MQIFSESHSVNIFAATWKNVPSDVCVQKRLKSACAYQILSCSHDDNFASMAIQIVSSEDSDQTVQSHSLI